MAEKSNPSRQAFGPGESGTMAFNIIAAGSPCEAIIKRRGQFEIVRCGRRSTGTVDVDACGVTDFIPACPDHIDQIGESVVSEAQDRGDFYIPRIGHNGWDRP